MRPYRILVASGIPNTFSNYRKDLRQLLSQRFAHAPSPPFSLQAAGYSVLAFWLGIYWGLVIKKILGISEIWLDLALWIQWTHAVLHFLMNDSRWDLLYFCVFSDLLLDSKRFVFSIFLNLRPLI